MSFSSYYKKMMHALPYVTFPVLILVAAVSGILKGGIWVWAGWLIIFILHPLLDACVGLQKEDDVNQVKLPHGLYSSFIYGYVPLQVALIFWVIAEQFKFDFLSAQWWGALLSVGAITGGIGFTVAHELMHRRKRWERGLSVLLLATVGYSHFRIEHVFGHHRYVATPIDPASSRRGEILYSFWIRSIWGTWLNAWRFEVKRLSRGNVYQKIINNRMVHYCVFQFTLVFFIGSFFGLEGLVFFIGQAVVAVVLLESVNYIEHYGLERKEIAPGRYEAVNEFHSWDSRHRMTNLFMFNLGRHAHHHAHPLVPYEKLEFSGAGHTMGLGYSALLWLALCPPLWMRFFRARLAE